MLNWMKRRGRPATYFEREPDSKPPRAMSGRYLLLYDYLQGRHADRVVLTFEQIESLLGFALPDEARHDQRWWTNAEGAAAGHSDAWILASRTATPNLLAQTVAFERAP